MRLFASFLSGMNPTIGASSNLRMSSWSNQTSDQLTQYAGQYISDELAATYRFIVRDGQLWLRVNSRRWEQLDATVRDEFIPHIREPTDGRIIRFLRNENDEVTGLSIDYYRVTAVRFEKR